MTALRTVLIQYSSNVNTLTASSIAAAEGQRKLAISVAEANAAIDKFGISSDKATAALARYDAAARSAAAANVNATAAFGRTAALIGGAMVVGLGAAAKAAMDFQSQLKQMQALTGQSDAQIKAMGKSILELSTQFPISAKELTGAATEIGRAGFAGASGIEVLKAAARGATVGLGDTKTIATDLTQVMASFGLGAASAGNTMNTIIAAVQKGHGSLEEFSNGLKAVGPIAAAEHIGFSDLAAAIAAMTRAGFDANNVGTSLNRTLLQMTAGAATTSKQMSPLYTAIVNMKDAQHENGFATAEAAIQTLGLAKVMDNLVQSTHGSMQEFQRLFPSVRTARGQLALTSQEGKVFKDVMSVVGDQTLANEAANKAVASAQGEYTNKIKEAENSAKAAGIAFGRDLQGPIVALAGFVANLASGFSALPGPIQGIIAGLTAIVGVGTLLGGIYAALAPKIATIAGNYATLGKTIFGTNSQMANTGAIAEEQIPGINAETAAIERLAAAKAAANGIPSAGVGFGGPSVAVRQSEGLALPAAVAGEETAATVGTGAVLAEGTATSALLGPVGLLTGALVLGTVALSSFGKAHRDAAAATDIMKTAVEQEAAGQHKEAQVTVIQELNDKKRLGTLREVAGSHQDYIKTLANVTNGILGNKQAQDSAKQTVLDYAKNLHVNKDGLKDIQAAFNGSTSAGGKFNTATQNQLRPLGALLTTIGQLTAGHKGASLSAKDLSDALSATSGAMTQEEQTAKDVTDAIAQMVNTQANFIINIAKTSQNAVNSFLDIKTIASTAESTSKGVATAANKVEAAFRAQENAAIALIRAQRSLTQANDAVIKTQQALNDLNSFGAAEDIEQSQINAARATLDHEKALIALTLAQKEYDQATQVHGGNLPAGAIVEGTQINYGFNYDPSLAGKNKTQQDLEIALKEAKLGVREATLSETQAQRDYNRLANGGEQEKIRLAEDAITEAVLNQKAAYEDLLKVQHDQAVAAQKGADATAGAAQAAAGKVKASFDELANQSKINTDKLNTWLDNIQHIASDGPETARAMRQKAAAELLQLGPDYSEATAQAVHASDEQLGKLAGLFDADARQATTAATAGLVAGFTTLSGVVGLTMDAVNKNTYAKFAETFGNLNAATQAFVNGLLGSANATISLVGGQPIVTSSDYNDVNQSFRSVTYNLATGQSHVEAHKMNALGAIEPHIANQPTILYGERSTGGEAFIPRQGISEHRAMGILGTAASWYGAQVTKMAAGGVMPEVPNLGTAPYQVVTTDILAELARQVALLRSSAPTSTQTSGGQIGGGGTIGGGHWQDIISFLDSKGIAHNNPTIGQTTGGQHASGSYHYCVPMDSEILTREGWKTYDKVQPGDETVGYNPETKRNEWTPILEKVNFEDATVIEASHSRINLRFTENHRWLVDKSRWMYTKDRTSKRLRDESAELEEFKDISNERRIRLAAETDTPHLLDITEDEVRMIAWAITDGWIHRSQTKTKGIRHSIRLYQKNPNFVPEVRSIAVEAGGREYLHNKQGVLGWYIPTEYSSDLMERARYDELGAEGFVLALGTAEREAFLDVCQKAEGSKKEKFKFIAQYKSDVKNAIELAAFLCGYTTVTNNDGVRLRRPHVERGKLQTRSLERQDVWCVVTGLGTWTMRQSNQVVLTGNSGKAVDLTGDMDLIFKTLLTVSNSLAELFYTPEGFSIKNSKVVRPPIAAAEHYNHVHAAVYDKGGFLPQGWSLAGNFTGKPEPVGHGNTVINMVPGMVSVQGTYSADLDIEAAARITARVVEPAINAAISSVVQQVLVRR